MRPVCLLLAPLKTGGFRGADVPAALAWSSPVTIGDSNRRSGGGNRGAGGLRDVGNSNVSSPLAGTVLHRNHVVNSTIMGDSRPVSGCCRTDIRVINTSACV